MWHIPLKAKAADHAPARVEHDMYEVDWVDEPLKPLTPRSVAGGNDKASGAWVLLGGGDFGSSLAQQLQQRGGDVVIVGTKGSVGNFDYTVQPDCATDYEQMFASLQRAGRKVRGVVHLFSLDFGALAMDDSNDDGSEAKVHQIPSYASTCAPLSLAVESEKSSAQFEQQHIYGTSGTEIATSRFSSEVM